MPDDEESDPATDHPADGHSLPDLDEHVTTLTGTCSVDGESGHEAGERLDSSEADTVDGWSCPRGEFGPHDRCLFHLSPDERRALGVDPSAVRDALMTATTTQGERVKELVGARFGDLDLGHRRLESADNFPVDLRGSTVGDLVLEDVVLQKVLRLDGASLGSVRIARSRVESRIEFDRATIHGDVELENEFVNYLSFADATVAGTFTGDPAMFERGLECQRCTFRDDVSFYADFNEEPKFHDATFEGEADFFVDFNADTYFTDARFEDAAQFYAVFNGTVRFNGARFEAPVEVYGQFNSDAHFPETTFEDRATFVRVGAEGASARFYEFANFKGTEFRGPADFENVEFHGRTDFTGASFGDTACFDDARSERRFDFEDVGLTSGATFVDAVLLGRTRFGLREHEGSRRVDLSGATVTNGRIAVPADRTVFDLTRATVGSVAIEGGSDRLFDHFAIAATTFDGFDFSAHRDELGRRDWVVHRTTLDRSEPLPPAMLEETYLKAKEGAKKAGEPSAESNFFRRELTARRRRHLAGLLSPTGVSSAVRSAGRYVANLAMDVTCGYGEKPWRVVASSVGIVTVFAAVFAVLGVSVGYTDHPVGHLILSTETFVALVLGGPTIRDPVVNFVTSLEAFLGAFFIALFVFTLTRSIRR